jgi:hypothetical protein
LLRLLHDLGTDGAEREPGDEALASPSDDDQVRFRLPSGREDRLGRIPASRDRGSGNASLREKVASARKRAVSALDFVRIDLPAPRL